MKLVKQITAAILAAVALCGFWSCDKEDGDGLSKAVLASATTLTFEAQDASKKTITVYSDANWVSEVPEWVTISPTQGSAGTTDVTVSVTDNMRGGAEDNPRKATLVFKGSTLASRAEVVISQNGDKYRDVEEYTPGQVAELADESVVSIPSALVVALGPDGFMVSDAANSGSVYIMSTETVAIGDKVSILGTKGSDTQSLAIVECDKVEVVSTGGTVTYPAAEDITSQIDSYNPGSRKYVSVKGVLVGSNITVEGAQYSVTITNATAHSTLSALNGHYVTAEGYFGGVAAPVVRLTLTKIKDDGVAKVIYFSEDFEWLDPWAKSVEAGQTVETDNLKAYCPQLPTPKVDGVSALDALKAKGYEFLRVTTKTEDECIYLQQNYLKFGKTSYQAGIVFPAMDNIPAGTKLKLSFDWCPMRQGEGKIDPVNLIVIISEGENEIATYDVPECGWENGHVLEWIRAEVEIIGVDITPETRITLRQTQWPASTANRWFLDNIELTKIF